MESTTEEVDPLLGTRLNTSQSMLNATIQIGSHGESGEFDHDDDDPLSLRSRDVGSKQKSLGQSTAHKKNETWSSLVEIARLGRLDVIRSKKASLRARLSALREDLEEDEALTRRKVRDAKSRQWVMEMLARDVNVSWERGNRAKSLRAACLLAGALAEKDDTIDYAKEWVLVITSLNKLHDLLRHHLQQPGDGSAEYSTMEDGTEDLARWNWYYRIGAIKGLVARLYIQASTWSLLGLKDVDEGSRLYAQSQGIGDTLVRQYFVAFLVSQGIIEHPSSVARDTLQSILYDPTALDMLLPLSLTFTACFASDPSSGASSITIQTFPQLVMAARTPIVLQALLKVTPADVVAPCAQVVLEKIEALSLVGAPTLVSIVADKLLVGEPALDESVAKATMNSAWLLLRQIESDESEGVLTCSAKFLELCCARYGAKEMTVLTKELERRVRESGNSRHNPAVMKACIALCTRVESDPVRFSYLITSDSFSRLFEGLANSYDDSTFAQSSPKKDLAKRLLRMFLRIDTSNIELTAAAEWAKALNDSIHLLTFEDERKQLDDLMRRFMEKAVCITGGIRSLDTRFSILRDLRGRFYNCEPALRILVSAVAFLARHARSINRDELCASCLAFCHATIPSILNPVERGLCYAQLAVLAMSIGKLPQADGLFKATVQCIADCVSESEERTLELVKTACSSLVLAPGQPSGFYLVRGLANAINKRQWGTRLGIEADASVLKIVEILTRTRLPYRVAGADSNDVLYGDDATTYSNEARALASALESKITSNPARTNEDIAQMQSLLAKIEVNLISRSDQVAVGKAASS